MTAPDRQSWTQWLVTLAIAAAGALGSYYGTISEVRSMVAVAQAEREGLASDVEELRQQQVRRQDSIDSFWRTDMPAMRERLAKIETESREQRVLLEQILRSIREER